MTLVPILTKMRSASMGLPTAKATADLNRYQNLQIDDEKRKRKKSTKLVLIFQFRVRNVEMKREMNGRLMSASKYYCY